MWYIHFWSSDIQHPHPHRLPPSLEFLLCLGLPLRPSSSLVEVLGGGCKFYNLQSAAACDGFESSLMTIRHEWICLLNPCLTSIRSREMQDGALGCSHSWKLCPAIYFAVPSWSDGGVKLPEGPCGSDTICLTWPADGLGAGSHQPQSAGKLLSGWRNTDSLKNLGTKNQNQNQHMAELHFIRVKRTRTFHTSDDVTASLWYWIILIYRCPNVVSLVTTQPARGRVRKINQMWLEQTKYFHFQRIKLFLPKEIYNVTTEKSGRVDAAEIKWTTTTTRGLEQQEPNETRLPPVSSPPPNDRCSWLLTRMLGVVQVFGSWLSSL